MGDLCADRQILRHQRMTKIISEFHVLVLSKIY